MKQVRKIYDKAFKEKAVQLSYDSTNASELARELGVTAPSVLYKSREKWTENQNERAQMLFDLYPDIKKAYNLSQQLRGIYNNNNDKHIAMTKLAHWYRNVEESGFKNFNILLNTITFNYRQS